MIDFPLAQVAFFALARHFKGYIGVTTGVYDPDSRKLSTAPLTLSSDFHFHFTNDLQCQDNLKLPTGLCLVNEISVLGYFDRFPNPLPGGGQAGNLSRG